MAQQESPGSSFDLAKLGTADRIVLGAAAAYFVWIFLPFWYRCCEILGVGADLGGVSGFRGVLVISWLLAIVAVAEIVATKLLGTEIKLPMKRGQVHLAVAAAALVFTLLGLVAKATGLTLSWGIFVGLILAAIWTYGAYMLSSQPGSA
jgi:hypothetical protein